MGTLDLYEEGFPHGTPDGYARGCQGSACPLHGDTEWLSCKEAASARRSDFSVQRNYRADQQIPRWATSLVAPAAAQVKEKVVADIDEDDFPVVEVPKPAPPRVEVVDPVRGADGRKHGTAFAYGKGCHTDEECPNAALGLETCRQYNARYQRELKARKKAGGLAPVSKAPVEEVSAPVLPPQSDPAAAPSSAGYDQLRRSNDTLAKRLEKAVDARKTAEADLAAAIDHVASLALELDVVKAQVRTQPPAPVAGVASQDYRDGVASGAKELAQRLIAVQSYGVGLEAVSIIDLMADQIVEEYGGTPTTWTVAPWSKEAVA